VQAAPIHEPEESIAAPRLASSGASCGFPGSRRLERGVFGYEEGMPDMSIPAADGTSLKAYLATPAGSGPHPGVVLIQDALGLTRAIREHVDRLASYGYLTLAPDLYTRGGMLRCVRATVGSLSSGQGAAYADIEEARRWLLGRDDCSGRVGVIGFCMGGGFALMTAGRGFDVCAANYGPLPKNLGAALGACPVVGSYGARDRTLKGAAAKLAAALAERGIPHDVKEYPNVGHSFLEQFPVGPLGPVLRVAGMGYEAGSAEDAWRRIRAFFDEHLAAGESPDAG
jgi:carboxymethylenebutenolidase